MDGAAPHPDSQAGFTIIETMVASVLLLVGLVATLTVLTQASATTVQTRTREQATNLQRELVEAARSVSFDKLTQNGLGDAVRLRPGLGDSSVGSAGWTIQRRNATYTVSMGVCTVDDSRDGIGPHPAGVYCAEGAPPTPAQCASYINASVLGQLPGAGVGANLGQCGIDANLDGTVDGLTNVAATVCLLSACPKLDENPADYKRIVSLVRWPGGYNLQTSQVNNPGSAAAPAVISLTPATNPVTAATQTSLSLASTTTNSPKTVALYRDGTFIANASPLGGANSWTANWDLGQVSDSPASQPTDGEVVDGTYELSEKAFNEQRQYDASGQLRQYGQYGATYTQTVVVNRRKHFAPAHVEAGRNASAVEIEWSPAKEKDSKGFRVYRELNNGSPVEVCSLAARTACRDANPPSVGLLDQLKYFVVGCDQDPCAKSAEGDRSELQQIPYSTPPEPGTPGSLQASLDNGNVKLTWTAPGGLPTSPPDHYNVYRTAQGAAGPSYTDRLDSVYVAAGQPLAYTDTRTTGQLHDYWITAVNSNLGESTKLGKVTR